ncbi:CASP C terminal-domain-containing protein [Boletus reticuloceps]|uniref:CASP C terminal-domain-containing protein n=1 Tax=Boletus reticuloceps TaxID=495285 RepID=A0A8I3ACD1_9AGAM|nr:CASP C terminal-domain-containing protein [Boletus reticuloceps]
MEAQVVLTAGHFGGEPGSRRTHRRVPQARTELFKQKSLNEKLEADLLALDKRSTNPPSIGETSVDDALAGLGLDLGLDNTKSKKGESSSSTTRSTPIPFTSSADTSILPIVTSQRDRFRARNAELEEELRRQFHTISELRFEIKSLQSDNLKLYEKVRYMQSYRETSSVSQLDPLPGSSRSHRADKPRVGGARDGGDEDEVELGRWRQRYEETMNPFEAFRGREATQAYTSLPLPEHLLVTLTRAVLGHRRARLAFVSYATGLHLLVVWVVWIVLAGFWYDDATPRIQWNVKQPINTRPIKGEDKTRSKEINTIVWQITPALRSDITYPDYTN